MATFKNVGSRETGADSHLTRLSSRGDQKAIFLSPTNFTDIHNPIVMEMANGLTNNCIDDQEKSVVIFNWVRDHLVYKVGLYCHKASDTILHGWGSCSNKANVLVAMLRAVDISAGFRVLNVSTREYFGPLAPHRFNRLLSERSLHVCTFINIKGVWLKCDPTDDTLLAIGTAHMSPQSTPVIFDGNAHAELKLTEDHILESTEHPIPSIDHIFLKNSRLNKDALFAMNLYLEFGRKFGKRYCSVHRYEQDFFSWFMSQYPAEYKKFLLLEAAVSAKPKSRDMGTQLNEGN